jgi:hypothetical protein
MASTQGIELLAAEVKEVIYTDENPNLVYGVKVKVLDDKPATDEESVTVQTAVPLNYNIVRIPIVGEIVLILKAPSSFASNLRNSQALYYIDIVSLQSSIHNNSLPTVTSFKSKGVKDERSNDYNEVSAGNTNKEEEAKVDPNFSENPTVKPLQHYVGDVIFEGRYGQSIRFSTTPASGNFKIQPKWSGGSPSAPITIFRNSKQGIDTKQINDFVTEDFTNEENIIVQASGQNIQFEQASGVTTSIDSKGITSWKDENWGTTPQTLISSGRIVFNSTQKEIIAFAKNGIGLSSETTIAIDAKDNVSINATKIELGTDADEPIILGNKWKEWAEKLIDDLGKVIVITPAGPSQPLSASPQWPTISAYKGKIPALLSDQSFVKKSGSITSGASGKVAPIPDFKLTPEEKVVAEEKVEEAKQAQEDPEKTPEEKQIAKEAESLNEEKVASGEDVSMSADGWELDDDDVEQSASQNFTFVKGSGASRASASAGGDYSGGGGGGGAGGGGGGGGTGRVTVNGTIEIDEKAKGLGVKAAKIARKDIGIVETPANSNAGGEGGRITAMLKNCGLGPGNFWCAAAVTTWWKEAGIKSPASGACSTWMSWAKKNGQWSSTPVVGAAVIYHFGRKAGADHIGLVVHIDPKGTITTIEGNTSARGQNSNGGGVFQKIASHKTVLGFVIPK